MHPPVLDLDEYLQPQILDLNIMLGVAHAMFGEDTTMQILHQLCLRNIIMFACKAWKILVDMSMEYNALHAVEYNCNMRPNDLRKRFVT